MKKLTIKISILIIPIFLLIGFVNYYIDPANILSKKGVESEIAVQLLVGNNIGGVLNYDDRLLQKEYAKGLEDSVHFLSLGSSRTMRLNQSQFQKSFYNASVSGAGLEDILAVYYLFESNNVLPKHIIIGLDPWILNANNTDARYKSLEQEYINQKDIVSGGGTSILNKISVPEQLKQILSFSYFQNAISSTGRPEMSQDTLCTTKLNEADGMLKLSDGSIVYDKAKRELTEEEVNDIVKQSVVGNSSYKLDGFYQLDSSKQTTFEQFIKYLVDKELKVTLVIPPYHPEVYEKFIENPYFEIVFKAEDYFKEVAKKYDVEIMGSYDPAVFGLDGGDFYDELHAKTIPIVFTD